MNVDVPVVMAGVGVFMSVALLTCALWLTARTAPTILAWLKRQLPGPAHIPWYTDEGLMCVCGWAPHDATPQDWVNHQEEATR